MDPKISLIFGLLVAILSLQADARYGRRDDRAGPTNGVDNILAEQVPRRGYRQGSGPVEDLGYSVVLQADGRQNRRPPKPFEDTDALQADARQVRGPNKALEDTFALQSDEKEFKFDLQADANGR